MKSVLIIDSENNGSENLKILINNTLEQRFLKKKHLPFLNTELEVLKKI